MDPAVIAAIEELPQLKVAALQKRYRELFGEESKSSNKQFLFRNRTGVGTILCRPSWFTFLLRERRA
jgi:hypothetical protein